MHPLLNIAVSAARQAGDIILRYSEQVHKVKVMPKNENDFYSEVDIRSEKSIVNTILKAYPKHGIISEESGNYQEDAEYVWIIDPLDGTKNYLHSFPFYCVSIAITYKNKIEHAVIYDPLRHECFTASRGSGAKLNDHRIRVSKINQLKLAMLGLSFSTKNESLAEKRFQLQQNLAHNVGGIRSTGSVALDLAYVAAGRLDGACTLAMQYWDIAAGALLILESGGLISDHRGNENYLQTGDIIAGTPKVFKQVLQKINTK